MSKCGWSAPHSPHWLWAGIIWCPGQRSEKKGPSIQNTPISLTPAQQETRDAVAQALDAGLTVAFYD